MADASDLKSDIRLDVRVRVPLPAPCELRGVWSENHMITTPLSEMKDNLSAYVKRAARPLIIA